MPIWVPPPEWDYVESNITQITGTTTGTTVTAGAANTKGSYTQLIASTLQDAYWIEVQICNSFTAATNTRMLLDIGIGAATERVLIPDLLAGHCGSNAAQPPRLYAFPLYIPAGSRITARTACATAAKTAGITVILRGRPRRGGDQFAGTHVTAYGITAASSQGVAVTPGVSGAFGSYTQITAGVSEDHKCLVFGAQLDSNTTAAAQSYMAKVGMGAATETDISNYHQMSVDASERCQGPEPSTPIWRAIPNGTRLAVALMQSSTTAQPLDIALYGVS